MIINEQEEKFRKEMDEYIVNKNNRYEQYRKELELLSEAEKFERCKDILKNEYVNFDDISQTNLRHAFFLDGKELGLNHEQIKEIYTIVQLNK